MSTPRLFLLPLMAAFAAAPAARAAVVLAADGQGAYDQQTGLTWAWSGSQVDLTGFRVATVDEAKDLFAHRQADIAGITTTDTYPLLDIADADVGLSADGQRYAEGISSGWSIYRPLGVAFGYTVSDCRLESGSACPANAQPGTLKWSGAAAFVEGADGSSVAVLLEAVSFSNQYGIHLYERGAIDPQGTALGTPAWTLRPTYVDSTGALKVSGYLMVKGVPEPSTYALVGLGLAAAAAVARRRRQG